MTTNVKYSSKPAATYVPAPGLATAVKVLVIICLLGAAGTALVEILMLATGQATGQAPTLNGDELSSNPAMAALEIADIVLALLRIPFMLAAGACFFVWLQRMHKNLPALGADGLKYSHGWVVGWWFVPLANLLHVPAVMQEVWKGSGPESSVADPRGWSALPDSPRISIWWLCWMGYPIVSYIARKTGFTEQSQANMLAASLLTDLLFIGAGVLIIGIMREIGERQEQRLAARAAALTSAGGSPYWPATMAPGAMPPGAMPPGANPIPSGYQPGSVPPRVAPPPPGMAPPGAVPQSWAPPPGTVPQGWAPPAGAVPPGANPPGWSPAPPGVPPGQPGDTPQG